MTSLTMPIAGRIRTYTSGCARNQKRCCHSSGLPLPATASAFPETTRPLGRKKLVPASRSINCSTPAASSGGNASSNRNDVTNCAHTKNGSRIQLRPLARSCTVVTMKLIEPSSDDVIRKIIPISHNVWPGAITASGGYDVQPDCAAPGPLSQPIWNKLASITTPPTKYDQ